jgi:hypothetical protein
MKWNLRIVQTTDTDGTWYEMREVYYDSEGVPFGHSNATVFSEDIDDMKEYVKHIKEAFDHPILFPDSFTGDPYL